jgi:hypothetical protein
LIAVGSFADHAQGFYLASILGGEFGTGDGPEFTDPGIHGRNTYLPVWIPLESLERTVVLPVALISIIVSAQQAGWPEQPVSFVDDPGPA